MYYNHSTLKFEDNCAELKHGRWFIKLGFAGFNCRANNYSGFSTSAEAEGTCLAYQAKGNSK